MLMGILWRKAKALKMLAVYQQFASKFKQIIAARYWY